MNEKKEIPVKCFLSDSMYLRMRSVLFAEDYTQSEYLRMLIREDLKKRENVQIAGIESALFEEEDRT